jgi:predicted RNA polymerase sigma factor
MFDGPEKGLELLQALEAPLAGHHRLHAVRGHLLEMAGDFGAAFAEYEAAAKLTTSLPERDYLTMKAARVNARACSP